jgi:polyribonucleotide nucleotidyltransferase
VTLRIDIDKIGALIGPQGKNIKALCEQYSVKINTDDDGTVTIFGKSSKDAEDAKTAVLGVVLDPEVGKVYDGTVKRVMEYGAFVEILPGKEGLAHISKLSRQRIDKVTDILNEGDKVPVKVIEIDKAGRINLSYIDAIDPNGAPADSERGHSDRGYSDRGHSDRGHSGRGHHSRENRYFRGH